MSHQQHLVVYGFYRMVSTLFQVVKTTITNLSKMIRILYPLQEAVPVALYKTRVKQFPFAKCCFHVACNTRAQNGFPYFDRPSANSKRVGSFLDEANGFWHRHWKAAFNGHSHSLKGNHRRSTVLLRPGRLGLFSCLP